MLHNFRRIFVLTLCLALVCTLSVTVFATTAYHDRVDYEYGAYIEVQAYIERFKTWGSTVAQSSSTVMEADVELSVTYRYINEEYQLTTVNISSSGLSDVSIYEDYSYNNIYSMVDATYAFWATMPDTYWEEFEDSIYLEYE